MIQSTPQETVDTQSENVTISKHVTLYPEHDAVVQSTAQDFSGNYSAALRFIIRSYQRHLSTKEAA